MLIEASNIRNREDEPAGSRSAYIYLLKGDSVWTKENAQRYGDFEPIICGREFTGTKPEIVHKSTARAENVHRMILPWFCGIQSDGKTLDNDESETVKQLTVCHTKQILFFLSSSGKAKQYGRMEERFSVLTQLF